MLKDQAKKEIQELAEKIDYHNYSYYQNHTSEISDHEFDQLLEKLIQLEKEYPEFKAPYSPTHPYWVNGFGWLYAWELDPGMRFHSVDGSSEIIAVEDTGREESAHNLVVADYHNYFVGEGRILSHDNSPRNPTNALVPGLMPDWSAVPADAQSQIGQAQQP